MSELPMLPMAPAEVDSQAAVEAALEVTDQRFKVEGMDCAACARTVEKAVGGLDGVRVARVAFGSATLEVAGEVDAWRVQAGWRALPRS